MHKASRILDSAALESLLLCKLEKTQAFLSDQFPDSPAANLCNLEHAEIEVRLSSQWRVNAFQKTEIRDGKQPGPHMCSCYKDAAKLSSELAESIMRSDGLLKPLEQFSEDVGKLIYSGSNNSHGHWLATVPSVGYYEDCKECRGTGEVNCSWCMGFGSTTEHRTDINGDSTTVYVTCLWCHNGRVECRSCSGSGVQTRFIHSSIYATPYHSLRLNENDQGKDLYNWAHSVSSQLWAEHFAFKLDNIAKKEREVEFTYSATVKLARMSFSISKHLFSISVGGLKGKIIRNDPIVDVIAREEIERILNARKLDSEGRRRLFLDLVRFPFFRLILDFKARGRLNSENELCNLTSGYMSMASARQFLGNIEVIHSAGTPQYSRFILPIASLLAAFIGGMLLMAKANHLPGFSSAYPAFLNFLPMILVVAGAFIASEYRKRMLKHIPQSLQLSSKITDQCVAILITLYVIGLFGSSAIEKKAEPLPRQSSRTSYESLGLREIVRNEYLQVVFLICPGR